jgi:hypothetical protein
VGKRHFPDPTAVVWNGTRTKLLALPRKSRAIRIGNWLDVIVANKLALTPIYRCT